MGNREGFSEGETAIREEIPSKKQSVYFNIFSKVDQWRRFNPAHNIVARFLRLAIATRKDADSAQAFWRGHCKIRQNALYQKLSKNDKAHPFSHISSFKVFLKAHSLPKALKNFIFAMTSPNRLSGGLRN